MKKRTRNLSECSDEEMVGILSAEVLGMGDSGEPAEIMVQAQQNQISMQPNNELLKLRMSQYASMLRAMQLWYHAAHHVTRGTGFFGDHADLFGTLYSKLTEDFDNAIEKAIGLTNDEMIACPVQITRLAYQVISKYPSPVSLTTLAMASTALEMEKNHNQLVSAMFNELEATGNLTLGLDDMLMATVNEHEGHIYKLQQRVKTELED